MLSPATSTIARAKATKRTRKIRILKTRQCTSQSSVFAFVRVVSSPSARGESFVREGGSMRLEYSGKVRSREKETKSDDLLTLAKLECP